MNRATELEDQLIRGGRVLDETLDGSLQAAVSAAWKFSSNLYLLSQNLKITVAGNGRGVCGGTAFKVVGVPIINSLHSYDRVVAFGLGLIWGPELPEPRKLNASKNPFAPADLQCILYSEPSCPRCPG